ncbi:late competence protein ComER [Bacillus sp. CGMCC 1.16607]|uniref:late competence protein ComER n=1 Tax=Bacillus sp. CGMCC 1.16607 TaxID=3351842 RepID=UPI003635A4FC
MEIGIIGIGNMGRILTEAMLDSNAVPPSSITVTNRTTAKALLLKDIYPEVTVETNIVEVAKRADLIFICVKPLDVYGVLKSIKHVLSKEKCIVSITSPICVTKLEKVVDCSVARAIPSITNRALSGVSLLTFGVNCESQWKEKLTQLFTHFSVPLEIEENITRVSSDIVSCGPAFFSYLVQRFIHAAIKETEIDQETATKLASEMLIGLGELLKQGHYTLPTLQEKVSVKGGITGVGINVLETELGDVFEHLFQATHRKFAEDLAHIQQQFSDE